MKPIKPEMLLPKPVGVQEADKLPWARGKYVQGEPQPLAVREPLTAEGALQVFHADGAILQMMGGK